MSDWEMISLTELTTKIGSGSTPRGGESTYKETGVSLIRSMNVHFNGFKYDGLVYLDEKQADKLKTVEVKQNDVLLNITGASIGRVTIAPPSMDGARVNQHVCIIRANERLFPNFLRWYLASPTKQNFIMNAQVGVTRQALTKEKIQGFKIPLPPVSEQKRIVAKIEELFSHIDAGVEGLKKTQRLLKQYRQSVLKAAVTGELTREWREENKDKVESAEELLDRVLEKKRQIAKGNYKEPERVEDIPFGLPEGWVWTNLDALIFNIESGKSFKCEERPPKENETGIIKVSAVTWGEFDSNESKTIVDESRINLNYKVQKGDFLFSRANTIELVGACVIVREISSELLLSDKILRFVLPDEWKEWVKTCLRTQFGRNEIERLATGNQESMRNISQGNIKRIRIPLPPKIELSELIKCVNEKIDSISRLEIETNMLLAKAERNKQSILISAFNGILHG